MGMQWRKGGNGQQPMQSYENKKTKTRESVQNLHREIIHCLFPSGLAVIPLRRFLSINQRLESGEIFCTFRSFSIIFDHFPHFYTYNYVKGPSLDCEQFLNRII